jgi:Fic family protein
MNAKDFIDPTTGRLVPTTSGSMAFIPSPLPPPSIDLESLVPIIARATRSLGELSGIGRTLTNPYLLIRPFLRKEATASSKIEGTVTTLSELFLFEADEQTTHAPSDVREVFNYVRALEGSLRKLDELPISRRLIQEAHKTLMTGVASHRGARIVPGEFRGDQNWIGARTIENARFVPPPAHEVTEAISQLEKYIHIQGDQTPTVIKMALVHYQFETIHPFPDGNGRVGRMLMPLMLCESKELSQPLLYLSAFLEKNYDTYIDRMFAVSTRGEWEAWIAFFLTGLAETCDDAILKAKSLQDMQSEYHERLQRARSSALLAKIIGLLFESPAMTIPSISRALDVSYNSAKKHIAKLESIGILTDSGFGRPRVWVARDIIDLVNK